MTNELGNQCTKWMIDKFQLNSFGSRTSKILIAFFNNISPIYVLCILIDLTKHRNLNILEITRNKLYEYAQIF